MPDLLRHRLILRIPVGRTSGSLHRQAALLRHIVQDIRCHDTMVEPTVTAEANPLRNILIALHVPKDLRSECFRLKFKHWCIHRGNLCRIHRCAQSLPIQHSGSEIRKRYMRRERIGQTDDLVKAPVHLQQEFKIHFGLRSKHQHQGFGHHIHDSVRHHDKPSACEVPLNLRNNVGSLVNALRHFRFILLPVAQAVCTALR